MEKLNLKQKLVEIRKEIGILRKTEIGNKKAMYVDPEVLLLKAREGMDKYGVLLSCEIIDYKITQIEAPTSNNPKNVDFLSQNTMIYKWMDIDSNDEISCPWSAVGSHMQDPSMAFGGSLTYAERYFMLKFFQIPTPKDDPEFLRVKSGMVEYITDDQISQLTDMILALNKTVDGYCEYKCIKSLSEIPKDWFNGCVSELQPVDGVA